MWYLLLLASTTPAVCENLHKDFTSNERLWGMLLPGREGYLQSMRTMAAAVGGRYHYDVIKAERAVSELNQEHAEKADRIVTLMIAHKCTPPDHVARPLTVGEEVEARSDQNK